MRWERLDNLIDVKKGKKPIFSESPSSISSRVLQIDDLRNDNNIKFTDDKSGIYANDEDILIAWDGANAGTIGYGKNGYIGSTIARLRKKNKDDFFTPYLGEFLNYNSNLLRQKSTGATIPHIDGKMLRSLKIPLPQISQQIKIAQILTQSENLIAQRKESISLLDEFLKSTFLEMFGDPVRNEKGWEKIQLQMVSKIQGGLTVTSKREINSIELPYLRVANVYRNTLELSNIKTIKVTKEEAERARLEKYDILIVEGHGNPNEIGRSSIWDGSISHCLHQNHLIRVRVGFNLSVPIYINYFINSSSGRQQMFKAGKTTSGLNTISTKIVKETLVNLPPLPLQNQFAKIVEKTEALKSQYQSSLVELENLFGVLSQKAFKGELDMGKMELGK